MLLRSLQTRYTRRMLLPRKSDLIWLLILIFAALTPKALAQETSLSVDLSGRKVIVLDPGHGGHDLGAVGPSGLAEKSLTLALAQEIKDILSGAYTVYLTRDGDYWVDIEKRTAIANHLRADVFVSLHAGGSFHHKAGGIAIYYFCPGTTQGLSLQQEENTVGTMDTLHLWDDIQSVHAAKSKLLADLVHRQLVAKLNPMDKGIHKAPCSVLRGADMPAILFEIGYVSHPAEEKELRDSNVLAAVAEAVGQGIREFFRQQGGCVRARDMIEEDIGTGRGAAW